MEPTRTLDRFLHACTPLPCSRLLGSHPETARGWMRAVLAATEPSLYPADAEPTLRALRREATALRVRRLPDDGVQPICDPARVQYLDEWLDGSSERRRQYRRLVDSEPVGIVRANLRVLEDAIVHSPAVELVGTGTDVLWRHIREISNPQSASTTTHA